MKRKHFLLTTIFIFVTGIIFALPRAEYPRPQFERKEWINLNGAWTYKFDFTNLGFDLNYKNSQGFDGKIIVPFAPESKLSGVGYTDFINCIWYQRNIEIPVQWKGKQIRLNFGAVYYESEMYIDGKFVGRHFGGSSSFSFDITRFVNPGGKHSLVVRASSNLRSFHQPAGKQSIQLHSAGCRYTRTTGIWQTVWMEAVAQKGLERVLVLTDIDRQQIIIQPKFYIESDSRCKITLKDGTRTVAVEEISATNSSLAIINVKKMKLWSPKSPFLYDLIYEVISPKGEIIDKVYSYAGMRKIHINGNKIYINNKPFYHRLVLDQGFYPDGIWTAPSDEALKQDIELGLAAGFNGARLHQKIFEERYYYWADKLGYVVWGESPSWGMDYNSIEAARNFIAEWSEYVIRDRNHPALLVWTVFNEAHNPDNRQYPRFAIDIYNITKGLDNTRPINIASGGTLIKTDLWTVHRYEQNPQKLRDTLYNDIKSPKIPTIFKFRERLNIMNDRFNNYTFEAYDKKMPFLIDEFGGIFWVEDKELRLKNSNNRLWGVMNKEEFYERLSGQVDAILSLSDYVGGYCYTQLTDVEQEQNGIYFYNRENKFDMNRIQAIFSKKPACME